MSTLSGTIEYIDIFAGIGGFRYGLEATGKISTNSQQRIRNQKGQYISLSKRSRGRKLEKFHCVYSNEWNKYARQIYKKHYGECDERDIRTVSTSEIPDHDLLCAGFPCQSFSIAGKRGGFNDTRGTLFFEIARVAKYHQPMFLLLENVKGLISHNNGKTLETILDTLQELGYYTNYEIYNSKNYGVPQNRERIFFLCTHIRGLINDGQNQRIISSERIITEWLFQILLNNLAVVKKLQGHISKDWLLGYLICQEIRLNPNLKGKNILDGIMIPMESNLLLFGDSEVWQNIDIWLLKNLGGSYKKLNISIISTAIKEIIESKTYTYSRMFLAILLATVHLRKSSKDLWKEILLNLIVIKEDTNYARNSVQTKEIIVTESGIAHLTKNLQTFSKYFIIGHLGEESGFQVFPIRESTQGVPQGIKQITVDRDQIANSLDANYYKGSRPTYGHRTMIAITDSGLHRQKQIRTDILPPLRKVLNTVQLFDGQKIRRLTPVDCERLQGFPDNYSREGLTDDGKSVSISDTQRYKCLGNAVTTNVITAIGNKFNE